MKNLFRLFLIACLVLPFAACKKAEAPKAEKPAVAMPTDPANKQGWQDYMGDIVMRNMEGVTNQPYAYLLPAESAADFQAQYDSLLDKAKSDVARGIIAGNLLAYGGPSSTRTADFVTETFKGVQPGTMKGVKVVFIGSRAESQLITRMVNASALKLHAATKINPKIVEYHAGSSDITQSIAAKVVQTISSASPGPLNICICFFTLRPVARSCCTDHQFKRIAPVDQMAK